jgi:hypothetical protein
MIETFFCKLLDLCILHFLASVLFFFKQIKANKANG